MYVTHKPEDGSPEQSWEFKPNRVRSSEQVIVEKQYGGSWAEFVAGVKSGQAFARRVLLWHLIRREHPAHQFRDTPDFFDDEFLVESSYAEATEAYDEWVKSGGPESKNGELLDGMFRAEIEAARERDLPRGAVDEAPGKAPSKSEPAPTSGPSPTPSESPHGTSASD